MNSNCEGMLILISFNVIISVCFTIGDGSLPVARALRTVFLRKQYSLRLADLSFEYRKKDLWYYCFLKWISDNSLPFRSKNRWKIKSRISHCGFKCTHFCRTTSILAAKRITIFLNEKVKNISCRSIVSLHSVRISDRKITQKIGFFAINFYKNDHKFGLPMNVYSCSFRS